MKRRELEALLDQCSVQPEEEVHFRAVDAVGNSEAGTVTFLRRGTYGVPQFRVSLEEHHLVKRRKPK